MDCTFCKLAKDKKNIEHENEFFFSFFDSFPVSPGHTLVVPKRHVVEIGSLKPIEWESLFDLIKKATNHIKKVDLKSIYQEKLDNPLSNLSVWFCQYALSSPYLNAKPSDFNHGVNDGRCAGRTVDHLHWHIIPRHQGDVDDPAGGVRFVIPQMGNYKISRSKLIRDKIPEIIKANGRKSTTHIANDSEYWDKLQTKLREEVEEFLENNNIEELADIHEVLNSIMDFKGFDKDILRSTREQKLKKRGGFKKKIILDKVEN